MYQIKQFNTAREFIEHNRDFIYLNPMQNILLINVINKIAKKELLALKAFNVVGNDINIIVLIVDGYCLIYCDNFNHNLIEILSKELPYEKLTSFYFAGDKDTIECLLKEKNLEFTIEKHLITYRCEKLNPDFKIASGRMRPANYSELNYLTNLSIDFTEEYDGNKENFEIMKMIVYSEINDKSLYVWDDSKVCAIALEMNRQGFPEIGKLYTVPNKRGNGYSSSLIFKLTEKILFNNPYSMLYTNGENEASNGTVTKVGYNKVADFIRVRLTN